MRIHLSVWLAGGAAEALIEQYNDQLREIRERGLADTDAAEPLRELLRDLRDQPRITEGSVKVCRPPCGYALMRRAAQPHD